MCEVILYGDTSFEMYNDGWTADDKRNALAYLKILESFEFIYALVTLQRSLMYLKEATVKLQGENQDLVAGVLLVEQVLENLQALRSDIDAYCSRILQHSSNIAERSKIVVSMPRIAQRQQYRSNPECRSVAEYFKCTIAIPFLDHLISELSSRFDTHMKQVSALQSLLPVKINPTSSAECIAAAIDFYFDDLPNPSVVDEEFEVWKLKWLPIPLQQRPQTLSELLEKCSSASFPNIFTLLKLFATLPLTSCSCERSASALKRLNNYMQEPMKKRRGRSVQLLRF